MKFFDHIDPGALDRRMWQLWFLALSTILVLATGLALMMYAVLFSKPVELTEGHFTTLFTAYCVLMPLLVGYLFDRHIVIKHLRRKIAEEEHQLMNLRFEARANLLDNLPGIAHFQDRLAMEFRRASRAEQPVSLVIVGVKPSVGRSNPAEATAVYGDAAKALTRKLRGEDSLYHFGQGAFAILLPRVQTSIAHRVVERLEEGLRDAAGPNGQFEFENRVTNYPDHVASARDIEKAVMDFLSETGRKHPPEQAAAPGDELQMKAISG